MRHALSADQVEESLRFFVDVVRGQDELSARAECPEDPRHRAVEGEGREKQEAGDRLAVHVEAGGRRAGQISVSHEHTLRQARRAGCVDDIGEVVRIGAAGEG